MNFTKAQNNKGRPEMAHEFKTPTQKHEEQVIKELQAIRKVLEKMERHLDHIAVQNS